MSRLTFVGALESRLLLTKIGVARRARDKRREMFLSTSLKLTVTSFAIAGRKEDKSQFKWIPSEKRTSLLSEKKNDFNFFAHIVVLKRRKASTQ